MDNFWNLYRAGDPIAETDAERAKSDAGQAKDRVQELEHALDRMTLASQAMWELLRTHLNLTDAELLQKINEIDLRDGVKDGRIHATMTECPKCGRPLSSRNTRCIYCGSEVPKTHVFQ